MCVCVCVCVSCFACFAQNCAINLIRAQDNHNTGANVCAGHGNATVSELQECEKQHVGCFKAAHHAALCAVSKSFGQGVLYFRNRCISRGISPYWCRTWFGIDLVSVLPFDSVAIVLDSTTFASLKTLRMLRVARLLKLLRVFRASRILKRWQAHLKFTCVCGWLCHAPWRSGALH